MSDSNLRSLTEPTSTAGGPLVVALSGAHRHVGWHVRLALESAGCEVRLLESDTISTPDLLARCLQGCDVVVHLDGDVRPSAGVAAQRTIRSAWSLVWACEASRVSPRLIVASPSAAAAGDSLEAAAAVEAATVLLEWARRHDVIATELQTPNIYGPAHEPSSRSRVADLCDALATGGSPKFDTDNKDELELIWVGDLAAEIVDYVLFPTDETGRVKLHGEYRATKSELADELSIIQQRFLDRGVLPADEDEFRRTLAITLSGHLPINVFQASAAEVVDSGNQMRYSLKAGETTATTLHTRTFHRIQVIDGAVRFEVARCSLDVSNEPVAGDPRVAWAAHELAAGSDNVCLIPPLSQYRLTNVGEGEAVLHVSVVQSDLDEGGDAYFDGQAAQSTAEGQRSRAA